jgi:hypothetical protein
VQIRWPDAQILHMQRTLTIKIVGGRGLERGGIASDSADDQRFLERR